MSDVLDLPLRSLFAANTPPPIGAGRADAVAPDPGHESVAWVATGNGGAPLATHPSDVERLLHEAVFALAARELAGLVRALPLERAAAALRDRDPVAAVSGLLADAALEHTATVTDDPLTLALLRGAQRKRELLAQAGGAWSTGTVAEHLAITRQGIDKRRQTGTLLGVRLPSGDWVYPVAQFGPEGAPLPGLAEVLGAFRGVASPWMRLEHLLAPDPALSEQVLRAAATRTSTVDDTSPAAAADTPRSAFQALRDDGPAALRAITAALQQAGDLDG